MLLFVCVLICFFLPFIQFLNFLPSAVLGAFAKLRKATVSSCLSVFIFVRQSAWNNSASIGTYFHEVWYLDIFRKSVGKIQLSLKCDENRLGDYQSGFRPSRSTIDNSFVIRQIIGKCYEYNIDIHNIFIDYTHALDSMKREKNIRFFNPV